MDSIRKKNSATVKKTNRIFSEKNSPQKTVSEKEPENFRKPTQPPLKKNKPRKHSLFRIILTIGSIFVVTTLAFFGYFSWKIGLATQTMSIHPRNTITIAQNTIEGAKAIITPIIHQTERIPLRGESDGRTNILLLGKANERTAGQKLTDTIMLASIDFKRKKSALLSLPRDLYVTVPKTDFSTKLNAIYQFDIQNETEGNSIRDTVSSITGLPIHYFIVVDYDGFKDIVDALGGVSVYVERDLYDTRYPGPNYSYETFEIKKGWQDLDGETALKYVRERHADPEGDFGRAKRQQEMLSSIRNKAFSAKTFFNPIAISDIIDTLGKHIRTDLSLKEIQSILALVEEIDTKNIETAVVDAWKKESLLRVSHVQIGSIAMFVLVPRTGDWSEIRELAENIFDIERIQMRREAIKNENARIAIINASENPLLENRIQKLIEESFFIKNTSLVNKTDSQEPGIHELQKQSFLIAKDKMKIPYTLDEIIRKFSIHIKEIDISNAEKFKNYDIIMVLGDDLAQRFSFEENDLNDIQNAENDPNYQRQTDEALSKKTSRHH